MKALADVYNEKNAIFAIPAADNGWVPPIVSEGIRADYVETLEQDKEFVAHGIELENKRMLFLIRCKEKGRGGSGTSTERFLDGIGRIISSQTGGRLYVPAIVSKKELLKLFDDMDAVGNNVLDEFNVISGTLGQGVLFELEDEAEQMEAAEEEAPMAGLAVPEPEFTTADKLQKALPTEHMCECGHPKARHKGKNGCSKCECDSNYLGDKWPTWTCQDCGEICYCAEEYREHLDNCEKRHQKRSQTVPEVSSYPGAMGTEHLHDFIEDVDERFRLAGETVERMKLGLQKQIDNLAKNGSVAAPITIPSSDPLVQYDWSMNAIEKELRTMAVVATEAGHDEVAMASLEVVFRGLRDLKERIQGV